MLRIYLLVLVLLLSGCEFSDDKPPVVKPPTHSVDPEWQMPAGDHAIDDPWPPRAFTVSIGGFSGPSFKVELVDSGKLIYHHNPKGFIESGGTSEEIWVTEGMWDEFRQQLNQAEVWKWCRRYDDLTVVDGTVWELEIEYSDQSIVSSGNNAYPTEKQFNLFLDAVSDLADGNLFE